MAPKRPPFRRLVTPEEVQVVCALLLADANERYNKSIRIVTEDVKDLVRVWLSSRPLADFVEMFYRAAASCDSDWLTVLYFPPDFLKQVGAMPHGKLLPIFPPGMTWKEAKEELIRQSLVRNQYNRSETAREVGMSTNTVYSTSRKSEGRVPVAPTKERQLVEHAKAILSDEWMELDALMVQLGSKGFSCTRLYAGRILKKNSRSFERDNSKFRLRPSAIPAEQT